jgi:hypothetical protein
MSIEGGDFHCYIHDFRTDSIKSWNTHMMKQEHYDIVSTKCIECGTGFTVEMPYQPIQADGSKNISLRCDACEAKLNK